MSYVLGPQHGDADGFPESATALQFHSPIGYTCLFPSGNSLGQGLREPITATPGAFTFLYATAMQTEGSMLQDGVVKKYVS